MITKEISWKCSFDEKQLNYNMYKHIVVIDNYQKAGSENMKGVLGPANLKMDPLFAESSGTRYNPIQWCQPCIIQNIQHQNILLTDATTKKLN